MKRLVLFACIVVFSSGIIKAGDLPDAYEYVDQVIWVVSDVEATMAHYSLLGFDQFKDLGVVEITSYTREQTSMARMMASTMMAM